LFPTQLPLPARGEITLLQANGVGRIAIRPDEHNTREGHHNEELEKHSDLSISTSWEEAEQNPCAEIQREEIEARNTSSRLQVLGVWKAVLSERLSCEVSVGEILWVYSGSWQDEEISKEKLKSEDYNVSFQDV
jgi:hypothetical protein